MQILLYILLTFINVNLFIILIDPLTSGIRVSLPWDWFGIMLSNYCARFDYMVDTKTDDIELWIIEYIKKLFLYILGKWKKKAEVYAWQTPFSVNYC